LLKLGSGQVRPEILKPPKGKMTGKSVTAILIDERREGR
jgi:hypothetical protein